MVVNFDFFRLPFGLFGAAGVERPRELIIQHSLQPWTRSAQITPVAGNIL